MNKIEFSKLETNRLYLRFVDLEDSFYYYQFCSNPNVCKYLSFNPFDSERKCKKIIKNMIRARLQETDYNYSLILKDTRAVIGSLSLEFKENKAAELGYILNENYWKKGYMSEIIHPFLDYCFNSLELNTIFARVISENESSIKFMENNGFIFIKKEPNSIQKNGIFYDILIYKFEK